MPVPYCCEGLFAIGARVVNAARGIAYGTKAGEMEYRAGVVRQFSTKEEQVFFRVFSGNKTAGGFVTAIPPKGSKWAQQALNLPNSNKANMLQKVTVPAGIKLERSRALGGRQWSIFGKRGGAEQFRIMPGQESMGVRFHQGVPLK